MPNTLTISVNNMEKSEVKMAAASPNHLHNVARKSLNAQRTKNSKKCKEEEFIHQIVIFKMIQVRNWQNIKKTLTALKLKEAERESLFRSTCG